jgi:hypothetical protein
MRTIAISLITTASLLLVPTIAWATPVPSAGPPAIPAAAPSRSPAHSGSPVPAVEPADTATTADDGMAAAELRQAEARRGQLAWHQGLAIAALVGMVGTGVVGQVLSYQKNVTLNVDALTATHVVLATTTTLLYGGAATLALTAPPPTQPALGNGGFDPIVLHRGISWLHAATLGATVTLGLMTLLQVPGLAGTHQVLAWTTTGLMLVSGGLIVLNF